MPDNNTKNNPPPPSGDTSENIDQWLSDIQSEIECDSRTATAIDNSLTLIMEKHKETKDILNYLYESLKDTDYIKHIRKIDRELGMIHVLYRSVLQQLNESQSSELKGLFAASFPKQPKTKRTSAHLLQRFLSRWRSGRHSL
ncbi:MAG: hypothetical protein LBV43_11415 [Prevotella sp.]|jgi:negative regulator of replication initiation|nr:hypothetical protein [Prevotella sp.]